LFQSSLGALNSQLENTQVELSQIKKLSDYKDTQLKELARRLEQFENSSEKTTSENAQKIRELLNAVTSKDEQLNILKSQLEQISEQEAVSKLHPLSENSLSNISTINYVSTKDVAPAINDAIDKIKNTSDITKDIISESNILLDRKNIAGAKAKYMDLLEQYNEQDSEKKRLLYPEIKALFSKIKDTEEQHAKQLLVKTKENITLYSKVDVIHDLIQKSFNSIDLDNIHDAKKLYSEALEYYRDLINNDKKLVFNDINILFNKIKNVDSNLDSINVTSNSDNIFGETNPLIIEENNNDLIHIRTLLEQSYASLKSRDVVQAKDCYSKALEVYHQLSADKKKELYKDINHLYISIKNT
jgi:hypothetical protein